MKRWVALVVACVSMLPLEVASAQESVDPDRERRARQHYEAGTAYFDTGDYESALREFRTSYAESPHPELLYNIYLCQERIGNLGEAVEALEAFLATPDVPRREILERRLAYLRERAARGETRIAAADATHDPPARVEDVAPAQAEDPPAASAVTPEPSARASSEPVLAIVGFSVAAAGLLTFGIAGAITLAEDARLGACAPACDASDVEVITASAIAADAGAAVALAGAVLGVVGLFVGGGGSSTDASAVRLRGLSIEGTF